MNPSTIFNGDCVDDEYDNEEDSNDNDDGREFILKFIYFIQANMQRDREINQSLIKKKTV
jgi:hypothetical protein